MIEERALSNLERSLKESAPDLFESYIKVAQAFAGFQQEAVTGSSLVDGGLLTGHGPLHIRKVIQKAGEIEQLCKVQFTDYEKFLLLVAIQVHDIGNILGRTGHEKKIGEVWDRALTPLDFDSFDKSLAIEIASLHGGSIDGSKDTISRIERETLWREHNVRAQFVAAVVRLADELSEDANRAQKLILELGQIPTESEVFHYFAAGVNSIIIEPSSLTVRMKLGYDMELFQRKFGKGRDEVYLLDEIYQRSMKALAESVYCTRFIPDLQIYRVHVDILIFRKNMVERVHEIKYLLEMPISPNGQSATVFDLCSDLARYQGGSPLTAQRLMDILATSESGNSVPPNDGDIAAGSPGSGPPTPLFERIFRRLGLLGKES